MRAFLHADTTSRILSQTSGGAAFTWPTLNQGDTLVLGLPSFTVKREDKPTDAHRVLQRVLFSIGRRDARPEKGTIRFQLGNPATAQVEGTNLTTALDFDFTGAELEAALNALSAKPATCVVTETDASFLVVFTGQTAYTTITARRNRLAPISTVDELRYIKDGDYIHELRLVQMPVAFADTFDTLLPPQPTIVQVLGGGSNGDVTWSEVQDLYIPPAFAGTFNLGIGFNKTDAITRDTTAEQLATLLNANLATTTSEVFEVQMLEGKNTARITFAGDLKGTNQPLLDITVTSNPPGDPTVQLKLDRPELNAVLRNAKNNEIKLPYEIKVDLENEVNDALTDTISFIGEVTIKAKVILDSYAVAENIDWLRPPDPITYAPRGSGQIANGVLHWSGPVGNGTDTEFDIDHNLDTDIAFPMVRRNVTSGELLVPGVDYTVAYTNDNTLTITALGDWITTPPDVDEWTVAVLGMAQASQYDAHTHSIDEVTGLRDELDALGAAVSALEALVPTGSLAASSLTAKSAEILFATLPSILEAFPSRSPIQSAPATGTAAATGGTEITTLASLDLSLLPTDGGLLPAVLDAKDEALTVPLPDADAAFKKRIFLLGGSDDVDLGGGGRKGTTLRPGEYAACDGTYWYRVARIADTEPNWYPFEFERELFMLAVTDKDLSLKRSLTFPVGFEVGVMSRRGLTLAEWQRTQYKNTRCQWQILFEHGTFATEAAAAGVAFTADAGTDKITAILDNCPDGTPVKLSTTVTLPGGLSTSLLYTRDTVGNERKLTATLGGAAINITDAGTGTHTITPQTASNNLKTVEWNATPMLSHTFQFTRTPVARSYAVRVSRSLVSSVDTMAADQIIMGNASTAGSAPSSANFAIRARLARFDIEDDVVDPRALVVLRGLNVEVIKGDATNGLVTLKTA